MSLNVRFLGHSTVLIESDGVTLLTDPVLSHRIFWIKRQTPLPINPGELPQPTAILVSHAHYDHLDFPSFKYVASEVPVIVPVGLKPLIAKFLKNPVTELETGSEISLNGHRLKSVAEKNNEFLPEFRRNFSPSLATEFIPWNFTVRSFPVAHQGFRVLPFRYTGCNGYLISLNGYKLFFPGDTAYRDFRKDLNQMEGVGTRAVSRPDFSEPSGSASGERIDVALMPIGCYQPEWLMKKRHIGPSEALQVFEEIRAKFMIPIHWGTFKLSTEPFHEPPVLLDQLASEKGIKEKIKILQPGESFSL